MGHHVHAALVLVDVGHEPVAEHATLPVPEVDTAHMAGEVGGHQEHGAVGAGGRDHGVDGGHVIVQPRHPEAALRTRGPVTLVRGLNVTLERGRGLELLGTLGALVNDRNFRINSLLLMADGLMPF